MPRRRGQRNALGTVVARGTEGGRWVGRWLGRGPCIFLGEEQRNVFVFAYVHARGKKERAATRKQRIYKMLLPLCTHLHTVFRVCVATCEIRPPSLLPSFRPASRTHVRWAKMVKLATRNLKFKQLNRYRIHCNTYFNAIFSSFLHA